MPTQPPPPVARRVAQGGATRDAAPESPRAGRPSRLRVGPRTFKIMWDGHSVAGIVLGLALFVIFFCGAFALWRGELLQWADPAFRTSTTAVTSVDALVGPILAEAPPAAGSGCDGGVALRQPPLPLPRLRDRGGRGRFALDRAGHGRGAAAPGAERDAGPPQRRPLLPPARPGRRGAGRSGGAVPPLRAGERARHPPPQAPRRLAHVPAPARPPRRPRRRPRRARYAGAAVHRRLRRDGGVLRACLPSSTGPSPSARSAATSTG